MRGFWCWASIAVLSLGLASAGPVTSQDALDALLALQSVTTSGITFRDYTPRVLDARIKIDQYLRTPENNDVDIRALMKSAMRYYEMAAEYWPLTVMPLSGWSMRMFQLERTMAEEFRSDKDFQACPAIVRILNAADSQNSKNKVLAEQELTKKPRAQNRYVIRSASEDSLAIAMTLRLSIQDLWSCANAKASEVEKALR